MTQEAKHKRSMSGATTHRTEVLVELGLEAA